MRNVFLNTSPSVVTVHRRRAILRRFPQGLIKNGLNSAPGHAPETIGAVHGMANGHRRHGHFPSIPENLRCQRQKK
jgi:hypothetical protein